jgi:PIN domain nuclease of toxin-antitoxin system
MEVLLDSHAILWFYNADNQLSEKIKDIISDTKNICYLSIGSLWEITIKYSLGKLELTNTLEDFFQFVERNQFIILEIDFNHLLKLNGLPLIHRDPFDRLIIAQGLSQNLKIATKDGVFHEYGVETIW